MCKYRRFGFRTTTRVTVKDFYPPDRISVVRGRRGKEVLELRVSPEREQMALAAIRECEPVLTCSSTNYESEAYWKRIRREGY